MLYYTILIYFTMRSAQLARLIANGFLQVPLFAVQLSPAATLMVSALVRKKYASLLSLVEVAVIVVIIIIVVFCVRVIPVIMLVGKTPASLVAQLIKTMHLQSRSRPWTYRLAVQAKAVGSMQKVCFKYFSITDGK